MILALYFLGALVALLDGTWRVLRRIAGLLPRHLQLPALLRPDLDVPLAGPVVARGHRPTCRRAVHADQDQPDVLDAGGYTEPIQEGTIPDLYMWLNSAAWAFGVAGDRLLVLHLQGA